MERNSQLRIAWELVENTGKSVFLTGKAGTGKTTFLKTIVERSRKRTIVVAPTGVAAINAGGVTIHSFFQLPLTPFVPNANIKNRFDFSKEKRSIIASLDLLIIDEISMVRSDLLDAIDHVLRRFRDHFKPFGGVQLLMIGDLQQLTPVVTPEDEKILAPFYDTPYFFGAKALAQTDYLTIQLEKVYRQQDNTFIDILNHVRNGQTTDADLQQLNSRYVPTFFPKEDDGYIRLTTHNRMADHYNENELRKLPSRAFSFDAKVEGSFPEFSYPTSPRLVLKTGTQVMFVKNDPTGQQRYYNGRIGKVTYVDEEKILVQCQGETHHIEVEALVWENAKYTLNPATREIETEVQGTFTQYPLRLAWAITIHKSQGLTFDHAIIDANLSFAPGQVYVALSRCRTLEGMVLATPLSRQAIINDPRVDNYIEHQEQNARQSIERLPQLKEEYFKHLLIELFDFQQLTRLQDQITRVFIEFFSRSHPQLEQLQRQTQADLRTKVTEVAAKWTQGIAKMTPQAVTAQPFMERVKRSAGYFATSLQELFTKPVSLSQQVRSNNKQAMARLDNVIAELMLTVRAKTLLLQCIEKEGFSITTYLKQKQMTLLETMERFSGGATPKRRTTERKNKAPKEKTENVSLKLFLNGMTPAQVAKERGLAIDTVISHLMKFIPQKVVKIDDLVSPEHQAAIKRVINIVGTGDGSAPIKALCPPEVTYQEIRIMLQQLK